METHDYTSPCIYLITVTTVDRKRLLGSLVGDSADAAHVEPSALGTYVAEAFRTVAAETSKKAGVWVQVLHYQIMPDHFHGIIRVHDTLPSIYHLGKIIASWKSACTKAYWAEDAALKFREPNKEKESLFNRGFNDRILFHEGQLDAWYEYLRDNPRRLWLKVHFPDRLRKVYDFRTDKKGHQYTAVGDTFLVKYPERLQVRCHRNLTEEQIQAEVDKYLKEARRGTVLVSPFISPAEKAVYEACYKEHLKMIRIVNRGLDGKFIYPSGRDLKGCSDGFMLVLAPYADYSPETAATRITRSQCLDMNDYAADIANVTLKCAEQNKNNDTEVLSRATKKSYLEELKNFSSENRERKRILVVAAVIFDNDGRIFATQRGYGDWKDWWEFPGGKMETGETPQQALKREIREELEAEIEVGELMKTIDFDYPNFHLTMHCLKCRLIGGVTLKEHEAAKWLRPEELNSVNWLPADEEIIEDLKNSK